MNKSKLKIKNLPIKQITRINFNTNAKIIFMKFESQ